MVWMAEGDLAEHRRNQLPLGWFFELIRRPPNGRKASTTELLGVASIARELLDLVVFTADDDDNTEFFVAAFERWGHMIEDTLAGLSDTYPRDHETGQIIDPLGGEL
jgi:hypothetical protein